MFKKNNYDKFHFNKIVRNIYYFFGFNEIFF